MEYIRVEAYFRREDQANAQKKDTTELNEVECEIWRTFLKYLRD